LRKNSGVAGQWYCRRESALSQRYTAKTTCFRTAIFQPARLSDVLDHHLLAMYARQT